MITKFGKPEVNEAIKEDLDFCRLWEKLLLRKKEALAKRAKKVPGGEVALAMNSLGKSLKSLKILQRPSK